MSLLCDICVLALVSNSISIALYPLAPPPSMTTQHSLPITWMPSQSRGWNSFLISLKAQWYALLTTGKSALVLFRVNPVCSI